MSANSPSRSGMIRRCFRSRGMRGRRTGHHPKRGAIRLRMNQAPGRCAESRGKAPFVQLKLIGDDVQGFFRPANRELIRA